MPMPRWHYAIEVIGYETDGAAVKLGEPDMRSKPPRLNRRHGAAESPSLDLPLCRHPACRRASGTPSPLGNNRQSDESGSIRSHKQSTGILIMRGMEICG